MAPRILLTSFEPFGSHAGNSSLEVGRLLARRPPRGVELDWLLLPVVAGACVERAWTAIEQAEPDLVVALGQAAGATALRVETVAVNLNHFRIPDNAGNRFLNQPIVAGGPVAYGATLATRRLVREVKRHGIPAELSGSAGTYVCNHLLYGLLHRARSLGATHQTGFLHLPLFTGQVGKRDLSPVRDLAELAAGVRIALAAAVETGNSPAPGILRGQQT